MISRLSVKLIAFYIMFIHYFNIYINIYMYIIKYYFKSPPLFVFFQYLIKQRCI